MVLSLNNLAEPIGSVKSWLRANNTIQLPSGWLICDGSTVVDASSPYNGKALPDFRGRFLRGHATLDNTSFSSDTIYFAGGTIPNGGADTNNLNHSHSGAAHQHLVNNNSHSHPIFSGGAHFHTTSNVNHSGEITFNPSTPNGPSYVTTTEGAHDHGGATSGHSSFYTEFDGGGNTGTALSSATDNRPAFRELLIIIKVK